MTASKPATHPNSGDGMIYSDDAKPHVAQSDLGKSDLAKVDAHVIQPHEYDDIPELTDEWFTRADFHVGGKLVRRGRPKLDAPKKQVTIRLDADLIDRLRASGAGWQGRINAVLRDWMERRS